MPYKMHDLWIESHSFDSIDRILWYKSNFNFDVAYFLCCWYHQMSYIALCKGYVKKPMIHFWDTCML